MSKPTKKRTPSDRQDTVRATEQAVIKAVAAALPPQFLEDAIETAVLKYISEFKVDDWEIKKLLQEAVQKRSVELLTTKYKDELDKLADVVAMKILNR